MTTPSSTEIDPWVQSGQMDLPHMGVIRVAGADAASFLQGQLTQDVAQLGEDGARLAGYCNAKGRMQVSFIAIKRSTEEVLLLCARGSVAPMIKRLSMFVLRAKAKLSDATAEYRMIGLCGSVVDLIKPAAPPWTRMDMGAASVVFLYPGAGVSRACWLAPMDTQAPSGPDLPLDYWHWLSVRSGIAMVGPTTFEAFVPQMLNYESVGGVSFKKGCYPGQEVVARSQFRGTLKRRAYLVHCASAMATGQEVFHASDLEQACGLVAAAAPCPDGHGFDGIVSMQISAAEDSAAGRLHLGTADGPALTVLPLPYPLLEDV
jgi:tRNA-modifying protein YgfZ